MRLLVLTSPGAVMSWGNRPQRHVVPAPTPPRPTFPPVFDTRPPTNITVTASKTAVMSCVVYNLANNSVSIVPPCNITVRQNNRQYTNLPSIHSNKLRKEFTKICVTWVIVNFRMYDVLWQTTCKEKFLYIELILTNVLIFYEQGLQLCVCAAFNTARIDAFADNNVQSGFIDWTRTVQC